MTRVFGWDLGGANVKLACVDGGRVAHVAQIPCPIISEPRKFDVAVEAALPPGLFVTGSSYRGIGIPACVRQGRASGRRAATVERL